MKKGVDYVGVTVSFLCHDGQGHFVMAKRSNQARDEQGRWDIGGGSLDFGEPHKFDDIGWFTLDALPENIHSQNPKFFELYCKDGMEDGTV